MKPYNVVLLPGDGIGPEVMDATKTVIDAAIAHVEGLELNLVSHSAGAAHYRETGVALPEDVMQACLDADAVLLAAIGLPDVRKPDGTEVQPDMMMGLRKEMDLYAAVRPCKLYPGVQSPLRESSGNVDVVIVRENLEGLFASFGGGCLVDDRVATDTIVITREGTRRICEMAFRLAEIRMRRSAGSVGRVTCVDKANVFRSFAFFRKVFEEVAEQHPTVTSDAIYVDAMSMFLVQRPDQFDVLVMENQFGDILSDLGAGIIGGLGMAPSAEIGTKRALFQPSHGSAPDIAGQNKANPIATMLSAVMMFDWLGEQHKDSRASEMARKLEAAIEATLATRTAQTADLGGTASTTDVADAVVKQLQS